jgi:hypothetical protein
VALLSIQDLTCLTSVHFKFPNAEEIRTRRVSSKLNAPARTKLQRAGKAENFTFEEIYPWYIPATPLLAPGYCHAEKLHL